MHPLFYHPFVNQHCCANRKFERLILIGNNQSSIIQNDGAANFWFYVCISDTSIND